MASRYTNRMQAGSILAEHLQAYQGRPGLLVLALPRGGVPVGWMVAQALAAPLDLFLVRKLGAPGQEELAIGAIAVGGARVLNQPMIREIGIDAAELAAITAREEHELQRRMHAYRGDRPPVQIGGKSVILVDDGLATGASMRAAVHAIRARQPASICIAVPVGAADTCAALRPLVDDLVCPLMPRELVAVGYWYDDFRQVSDDEVREFLITRSSPAAES